MEGQGDKWSNTFERLFADVESTGHSHMSVDTFGYVFLSKIQLGGKRMYKNIVPGVSHRLHH